MIKIREEGPDLSKWPGGVATIRITAREATEHMDENGNKITWVKVEPKKIVLRGPQCPIIDDAEAMARLKNHPPGTLIDLQTGQVMQSSPQARQKLIDAVTKAFEKDGKESSKNNPV